MQLNNAQVLTVATNPGKGAYATRTFTTVTLMNPANGSPIKVDWGRNPTPNTGDVVSCEVDATPTYGKHRLLNLISGVASAGRLEPATPRPSGFPIPGDSHQQSIIRQNALGHAVNLVMNFEHAFLGENSGAYDKDLIVKRVVEVAFTLAEFASGQLELDVTEGLAEKLRK